MDRLNHKLDAVEFIKQRQEKQLRLPESWGRIRCYTS
jgi:hypothetical protein